MSQLFALVASMGFLISGVSCVAITSEQMLMRSENKGASIEMSASGAMRSRKTETANEPDCNQDFPLGKADTCECDDEGAETTHTIIDSETACEEAAVMAGLGINPNAFVIKQDKQHYHPPGCFKDACTANEHGQCYFFNGIGTKPAKCGGPKLQDTVHGSPTYGEMTFVPEITGIPVCWRVMYSTGTANENDSCKKDYGAIMDQDTCTNYQECRDKCRGDILGYPGFIVSENNQSRHDDFPTGCFIHDGPGGDGCVYFNPSLTGWDKPKHPIGTPVCDVKVKSWIHASGDAASGTNTATEANAKAKTTTASPAATTR